MSMMSWAKRALLAKQSSKFRRFLCLCGVFLAYQPAFAVDFSNNFEGLNVTTVRTFSLTSGDITATFSGGTAFTIGNGALYHSGSKSWMVEPAGTNSRGTHTGSGTISFDTSLSQISFWVRSESGPALGIYGGEESVLATVTLLDIDGNVAQDSTTTTIVSQAWTQVDFTISEGARALQTIILEVSGEGMAALDDLSATAKIGSNSRPIADAGADQMVNEGDRVVLDGSWSTDTDGAISSYMWQQISPASPQLQLDDTSVVSPFFFTPDVGAEGETFILQLTVTDNEGAVDTDNVAVGVADVSDPSDESCPHWICKRSPSWRLEILRRSIEPVQESTE